jgi:hypothetical protein
LVVGVGEGGELRSALPKARRQRERAASTATHLVDARALAEQREPSMLLAEGGEKGWRWWWWSFLLLLLRTLLVVFFSNRWMDR